MNVIKDVIFEGNILKVINDSIAYLDTQIKEKTYLGHDGKFVTEEEYLKFVCQEIVVNAVIHRDYSIRGTDIQIKLFENRIVVESPGRLPGLVRADNIRHTHFSRNPKIAEFLKAYNFVKEYGEGVDRMYKELESVGLRPPAYYNKTFMLQMIIYNSSIGKSEIDTEKSGVEGRKSEIGEQKSEFENVKLPFDAIKSEIVKKQYNEPTLKNILKIYDEMDNDQISGASDIRRILKCSPSTASEIMFKMREMNILKEVKGKGKGKYRFANKDE